MTSSSCAQASSSTGTGSRELPTHSGRNGVSSNYRFDLAPHTWDFIRNTRSGTAVFTMPADPIKCAGAPQKIAYLAPTTGASRAC